MGLCELAIVDDGQLETTIGVDYDYFAYGTFSIDYQPAIMSKLPILDSGVVEPGTPGEFSRRPVWALIDTGSNLKNVLVYCIHPTSDYTEQDEFARAVEWVRIVNNIHSRDTKNCAVLVIGDFNDDDLRTQTASWSSQPAGTIAASDIAYPFYYGTYPDRQAAQANLTALKMVDTDDDRNTIWKDDPNPLITVERKLDYIAHCPNISIAGDEILNSEVSDQAQGLVKYGATLDFTDSRAASDHKAVFADLEIALADNSMDLITEVGVYTSPATTTGTDTITLSNFGGTAPKAVIFWSTGQSADGVTTECRMLFGSGLSASSRAVVGYGSNDAQATSQAARTQHDTFIIRLLTGTQTLVEGADLVSFTADTITLDWTTNSAAETQYNYLALGGDALEGVFLDAITSPSSNQSVAYTGVGFEPTALIGFSMVSAFAAPSNENHCIETVGIYDGTTAASIGIASQTGTAAANAFRILSTNFFDGREVTAGNALVVASATSLDSDGYTLNWTTTSAQNRPHWVLCLKCPNAKVVTVTQPTSDSTVVREIDFVPKAAICITGMAAASATIENDLRMGVGAWDSTNNQAFCGTLDQHAQDPTNCDRVQDSNEFIKHVDHAQTVVGSCTLAAAGSNLTETWTDTDGTARQHAMLVIGVDAVEGSAAAAGTASEPVTSKAVSSVT